MSIFECKHLSFVCTKFLFNVLPLKASVQFFSGCCHWSSRNELALIIPRYALCNMSKAHKPKLKGESTNEINDAKFFCKDDSTTFLNRSNTSKGAKKSKKLASVKNQDKRDVKAKNSHKKKKTKKPFDPTSGITHSLSKLEIGSNNVSQSKRVNDKRQVRAYSTQSAGPTHPGRTEHNALKEVVKYISSGAAKNIVVMCGAGISTASGIPDFRTPGTGLYDNLQRYKIPYPTAVFDSGYFQTNPRPFFELARELYPTGKYRPNSAHYFIRALHDKGLLLRLYTQNIDGLERIAGIPPSKLVEAHGTFSTASCVRCGKKCNGHDIKAKIFKGTIPRCQQTPLCYGVVKPDIVFFGDDLPQRFYYYLRDFPVCDLLIVMGTSLEVEPFASLVDSTRYNVPRLLLNRERVGPFVKRTRGRPKDYAITGELPDTVARLVKHLEWKEFVRELTAANEQDATLVESGKSTDPADGRTDSGVSSASSISSKDSEDGSGGVVGGVRAGVNIPPPVDSNVKRYFTTLRSTPLPKPNSRTRPLDVHASGEPPGLGKATSTSTSTAVTNVSYYDFIRTNASASASKKPQPSPTKPPQQVKPPGAEVPAIFSIAPAPTIQYAQAVKGKKRISPLAPRRGITLNRKLSTVSLPNLAHGTDGSGQSESSSSDGGSSSGSSNDS